MKLIILKQNLKEALGIVEKGVIENNNLPILKNVLIHADSRVKISTTNLEIGVTHYTAGKVIENGGITVPFSPVYNIISGSDSERITLSTNKNTLIIKTDNYEAKIQGVTEEEFPIIPKIENTSQFIEIEAEIFTNAINAIISAAQFSEIKPELSGVLFDFQVTLLKLTATDSFRLAEKTLNHTAFKTNLTKGVIVIIPLKTIQEMIRIFGSRGKLKIFLDPHQVLFQTENTEVISRLIDGTYPDYQAIIPKNLETELTLSRDNFITALKLVSNFSGRASDIKLKTPKESKTLEVYSSNQYLGENNYLVPVKNKGAGFEEVCFNWRYLLDGVKAVTASQIIFGVNGELKPAVLKPADDDSLLYIVMPTKAA